MGLKYTLVALGSTESPFHDCQVRLIRLDAERVWGDECSRFWRPEAAAQRLHAQAEDTIAAEREESPSPVLWETPPRERDVRNLRAGVPLPAGLTVARGILRRARALARRAGRLRVCRAALCSPGRTGRPGTVVCRPPGSSLKPASIPPFGPPPIDQTGSRALNLRNGTRQLVPAVRLRDPLGDPRTLPNGKPSPFTSPVNFPPDSENCLLLLQRRGDFPHRVMYIVGHVDLRGRPV